MLERCGGEGAGGVLKLVAKGRLRAFLAPGKPLALKSLYFVESEIQACVASSKREQKWLNRTDTAKVLGVASAVLSRWIAQGLLTPTFAPFGCAGQRWRRFPESAIQEFQETYAFTCQAAEILGIGILTLRDWMSQGVLTPVTIGETCRCHSHLFRRADLEQMHRVRKEKVTEGGVPERKLVSTVELAAYLGVTTTRVRQLISQKAIVPDAGPGIDGTTFYQFDLSAVTYKRRYRPYAPYRHKTRISP
jgi:hypothetical protein